MADSIAAFVDILRKVQIMSPYTKSVTLCNPGLFLAGKKQHWPHDGKRYILSYFLCEFKCYKSNS